MDDPILPPPVEPRPPKRLWNPFHVLARRWPFFFVGAILCVVVLSIGAVVMTQLLPSQYLGRVQLQIHSDATTYDGRPSELAHDHSTFVATQMEIVRSKPTLKAVVEDLNLTTKWNLGTAQATIARLKENLEVTPIRGTDLIAIEYYDTDPNNAADIANGIAKAYQNLRREASEDKAEKALSVLELQLKEQSDKLEKSRIRLLEVMEKHKIIDLSDGTPAWVENGTTDHAKTIESLEHTVAILDKLDGEALLKAAADLDIDNQTFKQRYPEYVSLATSEKALLASGLAGQHPKVVALRKSLEMTQEILLDSLSSANSNLKTRLAAAKDSLAQARKTNEANGLADRRKSIEYVEAKKEYELQKGAMSHMNTSLARENIDLKMPKSPITIYEHAEPNATAARPNPRLILLVGVVAGILAAPFAGILCMYLAHGLIRPRVQTPSVA